MIAAFAELEMVVLRRDLPEARLEAGDVGTVVLAHAAGAGFEVEFATRRLAESPKDPPPPPAAGDMEPPQARAPPPMLGATH